MRQIKYIMSGGLAFSENKDMEKLRRYSLNGWHVSGFKFMGYTLEKGEKSDYIYSVDYRWLKEDEEEEYFDFFTSSGWSHVASEGDIHLFQADSGTKPIYTDHETTIEKYNNSSKSMKNFAIPFVFITVLVWIGTMISSGTLKTILLVVAAILSVIAIPTAWTAITTYSNKWEVGGRRKKRNSQPSESNTIPSLISCCCYFVIRRWYRHYNCHLSLYGDWSVRISSCYLDHHVSFP